MPSGQLMTMPILIVNMGGEMVYILEQRLQAQNIPENKGQKVLNDVVRTMYYPRFIEELFKPQEMYSIQSTRQIFDRLAHSSIMRLNESSMDKLFDLMAMGFKLQIISCITPKEMIDITLNHLSALKKLVTSNPQLMELLGECQRQVHECYDTMLLADFNAMRQSLCNFFQDRKVKVSLFLHDHTQNNDGSIVVPSGGTLPASCQFVPGTVRYFAGGQEVRREALACISAQTWQLSSGRPTSLGCNLYEKDRSGADGAAGAAAGQAAAGAEGLPANAAAGSADPSRPATAPHEMAPTPGTAAAVGELKLLASLIGTQPAPPTEQFKLENLFGANVFSKDGRSNTGEIIQIDGTAPTDHTRHVDTVRRQMEGLGVGGDGTERPDDLLDLMDKA